MAAGVEKRRDERVRLTAIAVTKAFLVNLGRLLVIALV
jgi:hypothetical protein